ncbi:MAG: hypothetical protein A4E19_06620 [Nitrospira sp. SG-bin1]|nr:MAG: hypothetical protein A4E19_06620 [Nitrospira sp. SG-bin1]
MRYAIMLLYASVLTVVGCSHTIPPAATKPQPPPQLGSLSPTIPPVSAGVKQAQAPDSSLPVTVTADLSPLVRLIQATLPERFTEEDHPLGYDYTWRFLREGEPQVQVQDGIVKYRATYRGAIESPAARACRLDPLYPVIEGTGRLSFKEHEQGLLVTLVDPRTTIDLKPESDSSCNMFNIPVKDQLAEILNRETITQRISQSVDRAAYMIPLNLVWERLQQPILVGQANTQFCLYGQAREFIVGSMKGPAQQTTLTGAAKQTPVALYQAPCPQANDSHPMKIHMDRSVVAAQEGQPYRILLTVPVPYNLLSQQLQQRLFHQEIKLPTMLGDNLLIEQVTSSNANGQTLLTVNTSGSVNGTMYYWGAPRLERDGNVISISDLQMAAETKTELDKVKPGYWQMVDQELKARLRETATIDLSQQLGNVKQALSGRHKNGWLELDLFMARQQPAQVISTQNALVADVVLEGTASASGQLPIEQRMHVSPTLGNQPPQATRVPDEERLEKVSEVP